MNTDQSAQRVMILCHRFFRERFSCKGQPRFRCQWESFSQSAQVTCHMCQMNYVDIQLLPVVAGLPWDVSVVQKIQCDEMGQLGHYVVIVSDLVPGHRQ